MIHIIQNSVTPYRGAAARVDSTTPHRFQVVVVVHYYYLLPLLLLLRGSAVLLLFLMMMSGLNLARICRPNV